MTVSRSPTQFNIRRGHVAAAFGMILFWIFLGMSWKSTTPTIKVATWNVAAINNNPFEYWVTGGEQYDRLMKTFGRVVKEPSPTEDAPVKHIFTEEMAAGLFSELERAGLTGVHETRQVWETSLREMKAVSGFLNDKLIGKKRLISMFDRVTNTIPTPDGPKMRPSAINCYEGSLGSSPTQWWPDWIDFVFTRKIAVLGAAGSPPPTPREVVSMLKPIQKKKYPAISEEEERISLALQTLHAAIFDAILTHTLYNIDPHWESVRSLACEKLNTKKVPRVVEILRTTYADHDLVMLQECSSSLRAALEADPGVTSVFHLTAGSDFDAERNQNSLILLKKSIFTLPDDLSASLLKKYPVPGIGNGDLLMAVTIHKPSGEQLLVSSFHGDSDGLLTIPLMGSIDSFLQKNQRRIIMGMDANAHQEGSEESLGLLQLTADLKVKGLGNCWGKNPNVKNYTTYNVRTHLQSQLHKGTFYENRELEGDRSPKDIVIFREGDFVVKKTTKDNTGSGVYIEDMVFPTFDFPSDHGIVSTELELKNMRL